MVLRKGVRMWLGGLMEVDVACWVSRLKFGLTVLVDYEATRGAGARGRRSINYQTYFYAVSVFSWLKA